MSEFTNPLELALIATRVVIGKIGSLVLGVVDHTDHKYADKLSPDWERDED